MCEDGVGDAEVTLGVLEVDGVDFVGHGAGSYLTGFHLLAEIAHGDVLPDIAIEVDDDGADASQGVKECTEVVVVGYLRSPLFALQTEVLADKVRAEFAPVHIRVRDVVCVEVAGGTAELGGYRCAHEELHLLVDAVGEDLQFLAQTGGRGRLSVGFGEHGNVLPFVGKVVKLAHQGLQLRHDDVMQCLLDAQGCGGVVDILGSESEVDELFVS